MSSLLEQNRWLRDPEQRKRLLRISAASSSAVEGIRKPYADVRKRDAKSGKIIKTASARSRKSA